MSTTQEDNGSSGANQIVKAKFKVGYTKDNLTSWVGFEIDLPDTSGSFQDISSITKEQVIVWIKAIISETETTTGQSASWYEEQALREWDVIKIVHDKENNISNGTNEKQWV